jgi:hypothetical protein
MSTRLEHAILLANDCWEKMSVRHPEFVETYLDLAHDLLESKPLVTGDEFRDVCRKAGVFLPPNTHHNTWVSGVNALKNLGWITRVGDTEPVKPHNHMRTVTLWRSQLFG